jgi:hypothetical protein
MRVNCRNEINNDKKCAIKGDSTKIKWERWMQIGWVDFGKWSRQNHSKQRLHDEVWK